MRPLLALLLALLLPIPGSAVIHDLPDPAANTTPPPDDPGFVHVGSRGSFTAIYLGGGWVLSAAHVPFGPADFDGTSYTPEPNSKVVLAPEGGATLPPDLAVWRLLPPWPNLPAMPIQDTPLSSSDPLVMIGNGLARTGTTLCSGLPAYTTGAPHDIRWGTNHVEGFELVAIPSTSPTQETEAIVSFFECNGCNGSGGSEAMAANGDSGGGVFFKDGGTWRLAGIMFAIGGTCINTATQGAAPPPPPGVGGRTYSADLSVYRSQILALTPRPIPALPPAGLLLLGALLAAAGFPELRRRRA